MGEPAVCPMMMMAGDSFWPFVSSAIVLSVPACCSVLQCVAVR